MSLCLIGTGINFDLTLNTIEELKNSDEIYIETYTNLIEPGKIEKLEKLIKKKINVLERTLVESDFLIKRAKIAKIAFLASGDPLTATTHVTLVLDGKKAGVEVNTIHSSSIYTVAAGKSGLQIYKFGKTATLVNPRPNYAPTSSLEIIRQNQKMNLHSLVLLDTEPKFMDTKTALELLKEFGFAVVLSRLGENDEKINYGKTVDLLKNEKKLGAPPFTVIIPAPKLHPLEEEFLELYKISR
ncbi:diphthine synthase [Candidatus Micrarchaeota archaeon]|nr:diphthine synthase [Candidatus Micrarchaeota archaeon]